MWPTRHDELASECEVMYWCGADRTQFRPTGSLRGFYSLVAGASPLQGLRLLMLTPLEFAERVLLLKELVPFSVSSWGRTETHNTAVGGVPKSAHRHWLAADIIPDDTLSGGAGTLLQIAASRYDLEVIDEWATKGHYHVQVKGWATIAW